MSRSNKSKRDQAAISLATGSSVVATAKRVGVSESTVRRWNRQPEFRGLVRQLQGESMDQATSILRESAKHAATVLTRLMIDDRRPDTVRLRAADRILSHLIAVQDAAEFRDRLEALEAQVAAHQAPASEALSP